MSVLKIKNGSTWEEIPAGGVGVPSGGTQGQVLVKTGSADYATGWDDAQNVLPQWTLAGSSASSSEAVTYPSTAKELYIVANSAHWNAPQYTALFLTSVISDRVVLMVGGYYSGSSDYGLANVTHDATTHTVAFRNLRFGNNTSGTFYVYYR